MSHVCAPTNRFDRCLLQKRHDRGRRARRASLRVSLDAISFGEERSRYESYSIA
jgi:hypothetical protein